MKVTLGLAGISKNDNSAGGDEVRNVNKIDGDEGIHVSGMLTLNGSTDYVRMQVYHESSYSSVNMKIKVTICFGFGNNNMINLGK